MLDHKVCWVTFDTWYIGSVQIKADWHGARVQTIWKRSAFESAVTRDDRNPPNYLPMCRAKQK